MRGTVHVCEYSRIEARWWKPIRVKIVNQATIITSYDVFFLNNQWKFKGEVLVVSTILCVADHSKTKQTLLPWKNMHNCVPTTYSHFRKPITKTSTELPTSLNRSRSQDPLTWRRRLAPKILLGNISDLISIIRNHLKAGHYGLLMILKTKSYQDNVSLKNQNWEHVKNITEKNISTLNHKINFCVTTTWRTLRFQ